MYLDWKNPLIAVVFAASLIVPAPALAIEQDKGEPIKVYARTIEIDDRTDTATYTGDVSLTDGTLSLKADRIELRIKDDEIDTFDAFGKPVNVRYRPEDREEEMHAEAEHVKYYVKSRKLDLFGNVILQQEGSELRCPQLHYDLDARHFVAQGGSSGTRCYISIRRKERSRGN